MNINFYKMLKPFTLFMAFAVMALSFGCKSKNDPAPTAGVLRIYNASPTFLTYDIYYNGNKANSVAIPYGGGIKNTQYPVGTYDIKFKVAGESQDAFSKSGLNLQQDVLTSYYLLGKANQFELLTVVDNLSNLDIKKAYVRFINLSLNAPALDLFVKDKTSAISSNIPYKGYGTYTAVDAGTIKFNLKENSTGTVKAESDDVKIEIGNVYTIFAGGVYSNPAADERGLNIQVIKHQ
ncbi:DUF4397 domain-containing protein [Pedobacter montanisoli]|uniref:DUF4397 domain-containing protein n=1 Tax=Pedobacter montanisoli TaxID=2923277 RepID=A0ABS9ZTE3_9SPHI|nr:DUF4397 domain-containing protein [Pedobacter montanisoli]MCJ0741870.1 DUF4397 domain-containing protein [Pedobacter montanisoli]